MLATFLPLLSFLPLFTYKPMSETRRLLEAAAALSTILRDAGIPHAFYGSVLTAVLANAPLSDASIILA